ncbi:hypothetical protein Cabys_3706 [Caldithrix abyssi DSM 13497]|uniref:Uncharacterized protein n=1 Tax=Caldithrix abyssi DSM 13497 TaxID=880073 RepID=A0A1J1CDI7_CALAY|nr:hypothetical protein Cabys_3706 [Caldithrix abyssi DSM 13497]
MDSKINQKIRAQLKNVNFKQLISIITANLVLNMIYFGQQ